MHHKAKVPFAIVEQARDAKEYDGLSRRAVQELLWMQHGIEVSLGTLDDWIYYRCRCVK